VEQNGGDQGQKIQKGKRKKKRGSKREAEEYAKGCETRLDQQKKRMTGRDLYAIVKTCTGTQGTHA